MLLRISRDTLQSEISVEEAKKILVKLKNSMYFVPELYQPYMLQIGDKFTQTMNYIRDIEDISKMYIELLSHFISQIKEFKINGYSYLLYEMLYMESNKYMIGDLSALYRNIQERYNTDLAFVQNIYHSKDSNWVYDNRFRLFEKDNENLVDEVSEFAKFFFEQQNQEKEEYEKISKTKIDLWGILKTKKNVKWEYTEEPSVQIVSDEGDVIAIL